MNSHGRASKNAKVFDEVCEERPIVKFRSSTGIMEELW